jgi:hypothetical protein
LLFGAFGIVICPFPTVVDCVAPVGCVAPVQLAPCA